jgi:hypothetical protein
VSRKPAIKKKLFGTKELKSSKKPTVGIRESSSESEMEI